MDALTVPRHRELVPQTPVEDLMKAWDERLDLDHARSTRSAYLKGLRLFREWLLSEQLTLATVRPADIRRWREALREQYSTQSVNLWLSAVRRFYAFLIEEFSAPILNPAGEVRGASRRGTSRRHKRDELTAEEVRSVLATCEDSPVGTRDRAILSSMAYCALRTIEVQRADLADLQTRDGRTILWVCGKGRTEADDFVVLPDPAVQAIRAWLRVRGRKKGPLFSSLSRQNEGDRLTTRAIRGMVKARFAQAGVVGEAKSTHSLRHSAISAAIRNGAEPLQVQAMARHSSFDTTLGYYHEIARTENPAEDLINY